MCALDTLAPTAPGFVDFDMIGPNERQVNAGTEERREGAFVPVVASSKFL